jgi:hypothetical protein
MIKDQESDRGRSMTDLKVPLEAMLRRASRMAEEMFTAQGNVDMFWLVETASGERRTLVTPMVWPPGCDSAQFKRELIDKVREIFAQHGVERYALAFEGWIRRDSNLPALDASTAAGEIVVINADDGDRSFGARREIIRPEHGKAYLGPLSKIEASEASGRMDVFAPRPSSELPDDEGAVPGAPFQVLGRRGKTGELFVGGTFEPDGDFKEKISEAHEHGVEIVTGPEAERLIRCMQRRIVKH